MQLKRLPLCPKLQAFPMTLVGALLSSKATTEDWNSNKTHLSVGATEITLQGLMEFFFFLKEKSWCNTVVNTLLFFSISNQWISSFFCVSNSTQPSNAKDTTWARTKAFSSDAFDHHSQQVKLKEVRCFFELFPSYLPKIFSCKKTKHEIWFCWK